MFGYSKNSSFKLLNIVLFALKPIEATGGSSTGRPKTEERVRKTPKIATPNSFSAVSTRARPRQNLRPRNSGPSRRLILYLLCNFINQFYSFLFWFFEIQIFANVKIQKKYKKLFKLFWFWYINSRAAVSLNNFHTFAHFYYFKWNPNFLMFQFIFFFELDFI